jgi:hypothetical protein
MVLFSSVSDNNPGSWRVVNDGVMGGLSEGKIMYDNEDIMTFTGEVSLENNGGFSSIRYPMKTTDIKGKTTFILEVKGDGSQYQFRAKKNQGDYYSYVNYFQTSGEWETIEITIESLEPAFRGRMLNMDNFSADKLAEIGILIGNKKKQKFELQVKSIQLK